MELKISKIDIYLLLFDDDNEDDADERCDSNSSNKDFKCCTFSPIKIMS
jgi:hypothetical protein